MRSINTSLIAVLPVVGLMVIGVGLLGVGTLADLALVQMVGIIAGALSSLLLATPLLVDLKMRDRRYAEQASAGASPAASGGRRPPARRRRRHDRAASDGDPDLTDDDVLAGELRRERAMAAAAGAPARPGKTGQRPCRTRPARAASPRGRAASGHR